MLKTKVYLGLLLCLSVLLVSGCTSKETSEVSNIKTTPTSTVKETNNEMEAASENMIDETNSEVESTPAENVEEIDDQVESTPVNTVQETQESTEWNLYSNGRYGFSINYPTTWVAGEEADNGDGKLLYTGNPDIDIRVYGSLYYEGFKDSDSDEDEIKQFIKLDNGNDAVLTMGKKDGYVTYDVVHISASEIEYHFYAKVTESFFADNESVLLEVAKSLNTPK